MTQHHPEMGIRDFAEAAASEARQRADWIAIMDRFALYYFTGQYPNEMAFFRTAFFEARQRYETSQ